MSNFTRSGGRAKNWQSITNLSCCSIDFLTRRSISMKAMAFFMLFAFSMSSVFAQQNVQRTTFVNGCMSDAPTGFTEAEVASLYASECGDLTPTVVKTMVVNGTDCDWTAAITYEVKCGAFEDQFKIDYVGSDGIPPSLNEGAIVPVGGQDLMFCLDDVPSGPSELEISSLYSDNCSEVTVTKSGLPSGTNCEWSVTYVYTIKDACDNFATNLEVTYSGGDTQAPTVAKGEELPAADQFGIEACFSDKPAGPTEEDIASLYTDNCGNVTVTKISVSKGTDCKWMAEYTYTIKDDCNNFADSLVLRYMGGDYENPELSGVPGDVTVDCIDNIPQPDSKNVSASDNCATDLQIIVSDDNSQLGIGCTGGVLVRTYSATDECGRSVSQTQTITVLPAPMAEFDEVEDMEISCEEANGFEAGSLSYTNNGAGACEISGSVPGELSGTYTECGGTLTVNWTYTDDCDRTIEASKTITVLPAPMAMFDEVEDMEISCEEANGFEAGSLSYTNNGTGACEISGSVLGELSGTYTECGGTLTVNWTYKDDCDRTIEASKTITVLPAPMAEFDEVEDMEISCEEANGFEAGSLSYTNNGTGACEISGSVPGELSGTYTECGGTLTVSWTYTDDCKRTIEASKMITVLPAPMAMFDEIEDMEISCEEANGFEAGSLSYTNNGTGACEISGSVSGELSGTYTECGGTLTVNWTYTDDCERTIEASRTITVLPAPMAEFVQVEDITLSCEEAANLVVPTLDFSNGQSGDCGINGSAPGNISGTVDQCGGEIFINWQFTDACDRQITAKQVITVLPTPLAEFDEVEDMEISCEEANVFQASSLAYTNGGTGVCEISGSVEGEATPDYTECGGTITVSWTYTDDCDRTINAEQTVTVLPAPMAEFDEVEDMEISCEEANVFQASSLVYNNGGTGACEISGSVKGEATPDYTECGGKITVNWTYTDDCERTINAEQTVTVLPAPMAEFDEVEDMEISCEEANVFQASSLAYTNGGTGACEISGSVEGEATPDYTECGGKITVNWTYTDDCERTINAEQTVTVLPAPIAEFDEVEDMEISCEEANVFQASSLAYTNGGTGACEISGSVEGEATPDYTECGGKITVNWTYTDDCDRTINATKTVTVLPAPMAAFDEVEDMEISCEEANVFQASSLAYTNGGTGACEISGSVEGEATPDYTECGGTITVSWTYTDDCDRTINAEQTVTVLPAPMAEFDEVEDMEISCEEANVFQASSLAYTNGGTGACEISGSVEGEATPDYTECGGTITVSWTYTDDCDRTINAEQTVTVLPAPMAEFDEVEDMEISCEEANVFQASSLAYTNGGTGDCNISGSVPGELSGTYTECGGTLTVNWTFTDACERTIEASKTITVLPAPMAAFNPIEDASIACEDLATYQPEFLSYSNGGTGNCEISGSIQGEAEAFEGSCGTFVVNFTYTDDCGRTIMASQTITVVDETAPMLVGTLPIGESDVDACFENRPEGPSIETITGLFTDNCGNVNVTKEEIVVENTDCRWAVFIRYTIQDDCDNFATNIKIQYNGGDTSAPELVGVLPTGVTGLQCLSENPGGPEAGSLIELYTDNCGPVSIMQLEPVITGDDCGWTATYTYTVQDGCDNFADNIVIVNSGADTQAPIYNGELNGAFYNVTGCVDDELGEPSAEDVGEMFSDNCDADLTFTKTEEVFNNTETCQWLRIFVYTATDDCNNISEVVKITYEGKDEEAPMSTGVCDNETMTLEGCPVTAEISLQIGDEISIEDRDWTVGGISIEEMNGTLAPCFTDNCADVNELTFRVMAKGEDRTGCSTTLTVTFEVEDNCFNVSAPFTWTFIIEDTTAPVFTATPEETLYVDCGEEIPAADAAVISAIDTCDADVEITSNDEVGESDGCTYEIVRTYTATDGCNPIEFVQTITVNDDTTGPTLVGSTEDVVLECGSDQELEDVTAIDSCSDATITFEDYTDNTPWTALTQGNGSVDFTALPDGFTVTGSNQGTFGDTYLNVAFTTVKNVTLTFDFDYVNDDDFGGGYDNLVALIDGAVVAQLDDSASSTAIFELTAGQEFAIGILNPDDDCCGGATVTLSNVNFEVAELECPVVECFIRQYTAIDACGNTTIANQVVTYVDTEGPSFNEELPVDMTVECGSEIPEAAVLTASDDCSDATVVYDPGVSNRVCNVDDASNHTLWINNNGGLDATSKNWTATSTTSFEQFSDGTAKLTGTTANANDATQVFEFIVWYKDASTYDEWIATPNAASDTGFRKPKLNAGTTNGATLADAQTWMYYIMDESKDNKLVGQDAYAGVELALTHRPSNLVYGLQYGQKASLQSDDLGVSVWFEAIGEVNGVEYSSNGDFNVALSECVQDEDFEFNRNLCDATIVRTWTATDACGNETVTTQTITVSDTTGPEIECPDGQDFGLVDEAPTALADKAPYTDNCSADGQTQVFTDVVTSTFSAGVNTYEDRLLTSPADFSGDEELVNFDDIDTEGSIVALVGDEYSSQGVNISSPSSGVFGIAAGDNNSCSIPLSYMNSGPNGLTNDADGCPTELFRDIKFSFDSKINRIGYYLSSNPTDDVEIVVTCMSNGIVMGTETYATNGTSTFFGLESSDGFDEIIFDAVGTSISFFVVDDLRFEGGGSTTRDFTSVRTFTATDDCGNESTCDVTYTWSVLAGEGNPVACGDSITGDTSDAGLEDVAGPNGGIGNFYTFVGSGTNIAMFSTCENTDYDSRITVFTGDDNTVVADNDDSCGLQSELSFFAEEGVVYNVFVRGFSTRTGAYQLNVECSELEECDPFPAIVCGDVITGNTADEGVEDVSGPLGGIGNWYTFTGNGEDTVVLSTCENSDYDTRIDVFTGDCNVGYSFEAGNDDSCGVQSVVAFFAENGVEYHVFVRGYLSNVGNYELTVECGQSARQAQVVEEDVVIDFTAYPVPFDNEVNISYTFEFDTNVTIELFDTKGLQVFSETNKSYVTGSKGKSTFDLSRYSSQMFYVTLTTSQGSVTKKIVASGRK